MRYALAALPLLAMSLFSNPSQADPYLWCAVYNANSQPNCYFKTLEQCRAATLAGGGCTPNLDYNRQDTGGYGRRHHAMRY